MKTKLAITCFVVGASVASLAPVVSWASEDADVDRSHPTAYIKDSAITTKIKAKLAAEHPSSLAHIEVDTDANGVVWLSGNAETQTDIDKAVSIAKNTEGVVTVKNNLKIRKDA